MLSRRIIRLPVLAVLGAAALAAPPAAAKDEKVESRLDRAGIKYEVDADGDYKLVFNYKAEGRSQLVYVSGGTETVSGITIREVFAPAAQVSRDGVSGKQALDLLEASGKMKVGGWEIRGDYLYFVIKMLDSASSAELDAMLQIAAETADDMEIELSGSKDDF